MAKTAQPHDFRPMKIIGLLSWYEENPAPLVECVASAARICDHLIAVDGPYALFPGSTRKPFSGTEQADAILRTAAGAGIGCTIHASRQPWWGGEVEKRDFMFRLGSTFATEQDWFLRIDADEVLTHVPADVRSRLAESERDVGEVTLWERPAPEVAELVDSPDSEHPFRCLFRALPGIGIEQAHYIVTAVHNGRRTILHGPDEVPAERLLDVRLEHRSGQRPQGRKRLKADYYRTVDELGVERVGPFMEVERGES